jgi:hypothetical protein
MKIEYRKGPLGYAVIVNGKTRGVLRKRNEGGYSVRVYGHQFLVEPGSGADRLNRLVPGDKIGKVPSVHRRTLKEAKATIESVIKNIG